MTVLATPIDGEVSAMAVAANTGASKATPRAFEDAPQMLPARVERAIEAEQDRSERIIGWFQMGVVAFFAALYAVSRPAEGRNFDPMSLMLARWLPEPVVELIAQIFLKPVPWALSIYFGATCVRLLWSYSRRLPGWSLVGSIIIDMALLFGLIWSFHIQYGQPPAFYLKAPTILYVFIFIALRALRFEARYVVLAGVIAALGWFGMVVYAAAADPHGMPITRNYVEYMTSPRILWGAEIDKIVTILVVAVLLAWAMRNARGLLIRAVAEGAAAQDLKRFFSADIAQRITGAEEPLQPGQGELREAATLFLDLRGFTVMAQDLPPREAVALLGEYQSRMVPIIQRHNGTIDKFLGDGILASFGCAKPTNQHAADALRVVDEVMAETESWSAQRSAHGLPPLRVGAAVAAGRVLFGAVGDETRLEYTVIGDPVNLAAKLEKHTKVEKVRALTTAETYDLARAQGYAGAKELRTARAVGGVDENIDLAVLA
jgi:adenylate cyclase